MTKLDRVPAKVFAANAAANEIGQFGSAVAGSKLETADVATIQALSAWLDGWSEALVSGNRYPALQEMNGLLKVLSYQGAYALQEGIPEYDADTTYYIGSIVKKTGTFELYGSLTDDNLGNALVDGANWEPISPGTNIIDGETTNTLENVHLMTEAEFEVSEHPATDLECVPITSVPLDYYNGVTVAVNTEYAPVKDGVLVISGTTASTFTLKVDNDVTKTMGGFYLPVFVGQTITSSVAGVFYPYQGQ